MRSLEGMELFPSRWRQEPCGIPLSVKITKQEIRDLMMLVIVDETTGEKAFTTAALFSIPVETGGSQA